MSPQSQTFGGDLTESAGVGAVSSLGKKGEPVEELLFGPYRLLPGQRRLEREGVAIQIGGRAFDLLTILAKRAGEVVGKTELMNLLWQDRFADESNLRFHVTALRKVLGSKDIIANVAGRGYSLVAPVTRPRLEEARSGHRAALLPAPRGRLVGRQEILGDLPERLCEQRFLTIVGPGGIGKTSVALAVGHQLSASFAGDVCFFNVANESGSRSLVDGLALALDLSAQAVAAGQGLGSLLGDRRVLLILDSCEFAIDAAAALAEELFRDTPGVHVLATSREALRAQGEYICRLSPLPFPEKDTGLSVSDLLEFPAVQLFSERAAASDQAFRITADNAALVGAICRKLDGLALAIEIAAGRVRSYGVAEVERQLETQFALRWPGQRTAVSRHQTLHATLDWSHALLSPPERVTLRRLSIFPGNFNLKMATSVISNGVAMEGDADELVTSLIEKSLIQPTLVGRYGTYRLLDTTRSYASEKLAEAGENAMIGECHARLMLGLLAASSQNLDIDQMGLATGDLLANLRVALRATLTPDGDHELAAALVCAVQPVLTQIGLMTECIQWIDLALALIDPDILGSRRRQDLHMALSICSISTQGLSNAECENWSEGLVSARLPDDMSQELNCLFVLWAHMIRLPDYLEALSLSLRADRIAREQDNPGTLIMADWMVGVSHHHLGSFPTARERLERAMAGDIPEVRRALLARTGYHWRHSNMGTLSNTLWIQGYPDRALRLSSDSLEEARRSSQPILIVDAMAWHMIAMYLRGDDRAGIDVLASEMRTLAGSHGIESYVGFGLAIGALNRMAHGDVSSADEVDDGLRLLTKASYGVFHPFFRTESARFQAQAGSQVEENILARMMRPEENPEHWAAAAVRRNLGEILRCSGRRDEAMHQFAAALDQAQRQGSLAWELRATMSLYRDMTDGCERDDLREGLRNLRARFAGGDGTEDILLADRLLADPLRGGEGTETPACLGSRIGDA